jgi:SAM-dependent methyltransferase
VAPGMTALRQAIAGMIGHVLGRERGALAEDRRILEEVIFAHYRRDASIKTVLFVGCESYTAHYQQRHFASHDYRTLDPDPARSRFGARQHVVARLEQLQEHFPAGFFDLILCNGVYGWGLDRLEDCETALLQCEQCLAPGGHLLFGWNDVPKWDPAPLAAIRGLSRFSKYEFPPLGTSRYLTETPYRHTYSFYRKRAS